MITIYETTRPAFNNNVKYLYVVNNINKVPEGFEELKNKSYLIYKGIENGDNLIITYKDLMYLDYRSLKYLNNYTLVIDGVFNPYDIIKMYRDDINMILLKTNTISIDNNNNITWLDKEYEGTTFRNIAVACYYGKVTLMENELATYEFNTSLFSYFKDVNIYTAYFDGQLLKYVLDKYNVKYNLVSAKYYKLSVNVINNDKLDTLGESNKALSENWIKTHTSKTVANPMVNVINKLKKEGKSIVWTTFDSCYNKVSAKGCKKLYKAITSTNKINSDIGVFMMNPLINGYIKDYFDNNIDEDKYALSALLRFLYTTNVKELYLPSSRMKKLFNDFLS